MPVHNCGCETTSVGPGLAPDAGTCVPGMCRTGPQNVAACGNEPSTPVRVLVADPDRFLAGEYADYLVGQGFEVAVAADALECLRLLREFSPHVLVLEPSLPWGGGDGVVAAIREDPSLGGVSVIVVTSGCDRHVLYNLASVPMADYQQKPMDPSRLADRIRRVVENSRGPRDLPHQSAGEKNR